MTTRTFRQREEKLFRKLKTKRERLSALQLERKKLQKRLDVLDRKIKREEKQRSRKRLRSSNKRLREQKLRRSRFNRNLKTLRSLLRKTRRPKKRRRGGKIERGVQSGKIEKVKTTRGMELGEMRRWFFNKFNQAANFSSIDGYIRRFSNLASIEEVFMSITLFVKLRAGGYVKAEGSGGKNTRVKGFTPLSLLRALLPDAKRPSLRDVPGFPKIRIFDLIKLSGLAIMRYKDSGNYQMSEIKTVTLYGQS